MASQRAPAPTTPNMGKRKGPADEDDHEDANNKSFETRLVFMNKAATQPFFIPCHEASTIVQLLEAVRERVPALATTKSLLNVPISPRILLLLQETGAMNAHRRWDAWYSDNELGFSRWFTRNVANGSEQVIRVEIHLLAVNNGDQDREQLEAEAALREAGNANSKALERAEGYRGIATSKATILNKDKWFPTPLRSIDKECLERCIRATQWLKEPHTNTWFPPRAPKRVKKGNGFYAGKKQKKRRGPRRRKRATIGGEGAAESSGTEEEVEDDEAAEANEGNNGVEDEEEQDANAAAIDDNNDDEPMGLAFRPKTMKVGDDGNASNEGRETMEKTLPVRGPREK